MIEVAPEANSGHVPVLLGEVMQLLSCRSGGLYVDGTTGRGGYTRAMLEASAPDGRVVALDWDAEAVERVREGLGGYGPRLLVEKASFSDLPAVLERLGLGPVDGIVLDLGVSSPQLDDPERGFSFMAEGPLDMRMDRSNPVTAETLVNGMPEKDLADLIYRYGEERWSRRIARAIVERRRVQRITGTLDLAGIIKGAVPKTRDTLRIHPATRSFQALRIAVNGELDALEKLLDAAPGLLKPGGRLCIVSFHSLEDRMVKERFRTWSKPPAPPLRGLPVPPSAEERPLGRLVTRKAVQATPEEEMRNPRARSARLRCVEMIEREV